MVDGSSARELTVRALVTGALLGVVFAVGNVYVGLKTGVSDNATVTSAILGFAICRTFSRKSYSPLARRDLEPSPLFDGDADGASY
jgi:uncharacterized oligopeptide transporter (OPT) family protein